MYKLCSILLPFRVSLVPDTQSILTSHRFIAYLSTITDTYLLYPSYDPINNLTGSMSKYGSYRIQSESLVLYRTHTNIPLMIETLSIAIRMMSQAIQAILEEYS